MTRFAEVIGEPVGQSLSPAIHRRWLAALGIEGDYRATQVRSDELAGWLEERRADPDWLGCNVTIPHKERVAALVDEVEAEAAAIGAVNVVHRRGGRLVGANSDVDGIDAALGRVPLKGRKLALIGGGGAARAAVGYAARREVGELVVVVRDPARAESLRSIARGLRIELLGLGKAPRAIEGAAAIVNATPLGMTNAPPMPEELLEAVRGHDPGTTLFDMVYKPVRTPFLKAGGDASHAVDGLVMLVGQARRAFRLFFGVEPPDDKGGLHDLLAPLSGGSEPVMQPLQSRSIDSSSKRS